MTNRLSSNPATPAIPLPHRYGGIVDARAELALNNFGDSYHLAGSGTVRRITPLPPGPPVTLMLQAAASFVHSTQLLLPSGLDMLCQAGDVLTFASQGDGIWKCVGVSFTDQLLHVQDQKTSGTSAGGLTSGGYQQRALNTVVRNSISGASLSSNQIALPGGNYVADIAVPGYYINQHRGLLYNVTDAADVLYGTSEYSGAGGTGDPSTSWSCIRGRFSVPIGGKTYEVEQRCTTTNAANGRGVPSSFGHIEIYTNVFIRRST